MLMRCPGPSAAIHHPALLDRAATQSSLPRACSSRGTNRNSEAFEKKILSGDDGVKIFVCLFVLTTLLNRNSVTSSLRRSVSVLKDKHGNF